VDAEFFQSVGPLRGLKGTVYEGGIRVPLIVRWPGHIAPHTESDLLCAHYDALATILDVAGVPLTADTDGISYLPTLLSQQDQQATHPYLFWDFAGYGGQIAVRIGRWKGVRRDLRRNPDAPLELYDLQADVGETTDVGPQHPDVVAQMRRIMLEAREPPSVKAFQFGQYR
jgi:arylsulfatase